jgi:hypothetical protein
LTGGRVERRLAAILAADVAGYSRLMGADEVGTLEALKAHRRELVDPAIASHKGRIVKTTGDGMLVEFASVVDAVTCAVVVQGRMAERNKATEPKISFRIGNMDPETKAKLDAVLGRKSELEAAGLPVKVEPVDLGRVALKLPRGSHRQIEDHCFQA